MDDLFCTTPFKTAYGDSSREYKDAKDFPEGMSREDIAIGFWLSAALDDDNVCETMKADIRAWFEQHGID